MRPDAPAPSGDPRLVPSWVAYLRASPGPATLAILSFGAAAIHFAVSPDHFGEWPPYGFAFACLAWFQLLWGAAYLARPAPGWAVAAIVVNALTILVWAWSRTVGLPFGPEPGATEPIGFADALSSLLEALIVAGLLADRLARRRRLGAVSPTWAPIVLAVTAVVFAATIAALAALAPAAMAGG